MAKTKGTELHAFARDAIRLGIQLKMTKKNENIARYVNDAIKHNMRPEQKLKYSSLFFGCADAIEFDERNNVLRIFDLKTGVTPAKLDQLLIYDSLFCLEYGKDPFKIDHDIRIYQNNDVLADNPTGEMIRPIMDKIVDFDRRVRDYLEGEIWTN